MRCRRRRELLRGAVSPKRIPPFAWGGDEPYDRYELSKFLEVAERMMDRRHVALTEPSRRQLAEAYRISGEQARNCCVLGSGAKAIAVLMQAGSTRVLVDAGFSTRAMAKRLGSNLVSIPN